MYEKLKTYMEDSYLFTFNEEITTESDLLKMGIIDSYGYIKLINYIEKEFGIRFTEDEILDNIFVSLSGLVGCVNRKLAV